jgi:hypothetical protein
MDLLADQAKASRKLEKQGEVLPRLWELLGTADKAIKSAQASFGRAPDFARNTDQQNEAVIRSMNISDESKDYLRRAPDKFRAFYRIQKTMELQNAKDRWYDVRDFLHSHRIFLDSELRTEFEVVVEQLLTKWVSEEVTLDAPAEVQLQSLEVRHKSIQPGLDRIERLIQLRLGYDTAQHGGLGTN